MLRKLPLMLLLLLSTYTINGQTLSIFKITSEPSKNICLGKKVYVTYTKTGGYNQDNSFKLQIKSVYSSTWSDVAVTDSLGYFVATLPTNVTNISNGYSNYADFRLLSSSPAVVSSSYSYIDVYSPINIEITGIEKSTLFPFEPVLMSLKTEGSAPFTMLMSDSTYVKVSSNNTKDVTIAPNKSGNYSILAVSNGCGIGKSTGSVNIKVFDNSLKIIAVTNNHICKNDKVGLKVQKTGKWSTGNKFKVRITEAYSNSIAKVYEFDAVESNDLLYATINDAVPNGIYKVKVVASDNNIESDNSIVYLNIHNESKVDIITESSSIKYGETQNLNISINGYGYYSFELSDGQVYTSNYNYDVSDYGSTISLTVAPKETTQYFVKSFKTQCGSGIGKNKVLITVNKAIKTDSLKGGRYCEGSTCEVKFSSNVSLPIGSKLKIRLRGNTLFGNTTYLDLEGKVLRENVASFVIPTNLSYTFYNTNLYVMVFLDDVVGTNFSPNYINVSVFPYANISNSNSSAYINLTKPQIANIDIVLNGGGDYEITMLDSLKFKFENGNSWQTVTSVPIYIDKSSTIGIRSITNVCGTNKNVSTQNKYVNIADSDYSIKIVSNKSTSIEVCTGGKIDLSTLINGKYGDDNQFTIELISRYNPSYSRNLGIITAGERQIIVPLDVQNGEYTIRVSASNPLLYSNSIKVLIRSLPVADYYAYNATSIAYGEYIYTTLNLQGGGRQMVTYKDGKVEFFETDSYNGTYGTSNSTRMYATTTFGIKSISNVCGIGTIKNKDFTITVTPYSIKNLVGVNNRDGVQCLTDKLIVPFDIKGRVPIGTTFSVQMSINSDSIYTTLQSGITESPAYVLIPSKFQQSGYYNIRIINNDNSIKSDVVTVGFKDVPKNMSLQFYDGATTTEVEAGNGVYIYSNTYQSYSYSNTLRYVISDDKNYKTIGYSDNNYIQYYMTPTETTSYRLTSASFECGVANVSGSVKVIVKPSLLMNFGGSSNNFTTCVGAPVNVNLNSIGKFEADNVFKVYAIDEKNIKTELLKATQNGDYKITFGDDLKRGSYRIQLESSKPYQIKDINNVTLVTKLDVTLMGSPIINAGGDGYIYIKNNDPYIEGTSSNYNDIFSYTLSNGKTGFTQFYSNKNLAFLYVNLLKTETFTLKTISNSCGEGKVSGTATVTVNPASNKQVYVYDINNSTICAGSTINVNFSTLGTFSATNKFTVQLSDKTGKNFKDLETTGTTSPLKVKIPSDITSESGYYMRVISSDQDATSSTNTIPLTVLSGITARFDTTSYYFASNKTVAIKIKFMGTPPFNFSIGSDEISAKTFTSLTNEYVLTVNPIANTAYRLFSVNNQVCGSGTVLSPSTVKLELITATEEAGKLGINVFPNPTSDIINIESDDKELDIQLIDLFGKVVHEEKLKGEYKRIDLSKVGAGTYLLHIQKEGKQATFKLFKQ